MNSRLKYLQIASFLLFPYLAITQEFGAPGTTWHHCFLFDWEIPPTFHNVRVQSIDSLEMFGLSCATLAIEEHTGFTSKDTMIVCSSDGQVFYVEGDSLISLYDFALEAGDTFTIQVPPSLYDDWLPEQYPDEYQMALRPKKIVIDSLVIVMIDTLPLTRQYISYVGEYEYVFVGRYITERLGFESWIFPYISIDFAEINPGSDLQRYRDHEIELIDTSLSCSISTVQETERLLHIKAFPNPVSLTLSLEELDDFDSVIIYTVGGIPVKDVDPIGSSLDVSDLTPGFYWIMARMRNGSNYCTSFVKI